MFTGEILLPIDREKFDGGKLHSSVENKIVSFLSERKERAFTSHEIMGGVHFRTDFNTLEIAKMSTFAISDFTALLYDLVRRGKVRMKVVRGRMYFMVGRSGAKCPKCKIAVEEPKKTWKMAGRPDKSGKRLQLQIGLFKCPKHGTFRTVLHKQKI